jgi:hypothetical protein
LHYSESILLSTGERDVSEAMPFKCQDCQREGTVEERNGLIIVRLVGVPAAKCCERAGSDGYKVTAAFVTTPG